MKEVLLFERFSTNLENELFFDKVDSMFQMGKNRSLSLLHPNETKDSFGRRKSKNCQTTNSDRIEFSRQLFYRIGIFFVEVAKRSLHSFRSVEGAVRTRRRESNKSRKENSRINDGGQVEIFRSPIVFRSINRRTSLSFVSDDRWKSQRVDVRRLSRRSILLGRLFARWTTLNHHNQNYVVEQILFTKNNFNKKFATDFYWRKVHTETERRFCFHRSANEPTRRKSSQSIFSLLMRNESSQTNNRTEKAALHSSACLSFLDRHLCEKIFLMKTFFLLLVCLWNVDGRTFPSLFSVKIDSDQVKSQFSQSNIRRIVPI